MLGVGMWQKNSAVVVILCEKLSSHYSKINTFLISPLKIW
jgi:hypothetical protein